MTSTDHIADMLSTILNNQQKLMQHLSPPATDLTEVRERLTVMETQQKQLVQHLRMPMTSEALKISASGDQVLNTVELLERILGNLDIPGLLVAYQVNKIFRKVIEGSVILQKRMHLIPDTKAQFQVVPSGFGTWFGSFTFDIELRSIEHDPWLNVYNDSVDSNAVLRGTFHHHCASQNVPPVLGDKMRRAHITQPPATELEVEIVCCHKRNVKVYDISCQKGIRISWLVDMVAEMQTETERCIECRLRTEMDLPVSPKVTLTKEVVLGSDHPKYQERKALELQRRKILLTTTKRTHEAGQCDCNMIIGNGSYKCPWFRRLGLVDCPESEIVVEEQEAQSE